MNDKEYIEDENFKKIFGETLKNQRLEELDEESDFPIPKEWAEFNNELFPEQKWTIKDHIPYEGLVVLASPAGEKKTWIAMEMARCIARGIDFLGRYPTVGGNVLYINSEMSKGLFQQRGRQLSFQEINENKIWILNQDGINFQKEMYQNWLNAFILSFQIKVVFIDTFIATSGGMDVNKAELIREYFNLFKPYKDKGVI